MPVHRYLLVLDMDLLAMDEEHDLAPINYCVARQEQEPSEVVVLSLVTNTPKTPTVILGGEGIFSHPSLEARPDLRARAEHRMSLAVRHLKMIGCRASGFISQEDLVSAVHAETRVHDYDGVILATGRQGGHQLAHALGRDPVQILRREWGDRLVTFPDGSGEESPG